MYLVVVGWLYVVLMMVAAEATTGSILGAIVTLFFYGLLPLALVVYLMSGPYRRRRMRASEAALDPASHATAVPDTAAAPTSDTPDAGAHAPGAAEAGGIAPVREETR